MKTILLLLSILLCACATEVISPSETSVADQATKALAPVGRFSLVNLESLEPHKAKAQKFFVLIIQDKEAEKVKHTGTHLDGVNVLSTILASPDYSVRVSTYGRWPTDKYSAVTAYYTKSEGIKLNTYKLGRSECAIVKTLVHEYMHHLGFSHGDNKAKGKEFSIPYWYGYKAYKYCKEGKL